MLFRSVQTQALALYRQLQPRASTESRRELGWAAALHEIGMMVSHHDHHRHSAYLLAHVDAPGFSQSQQRRLGDLALGQRGGLRKLEAQLQDEGLLWQLLALRLAVLICHGREAVPAGLLKLQREARIVQLKLPQGWAGAQPRAAFLLNQEIEAWGRSGLLSLQLAG